MQNNMIRLFHANYKKPSIGKECQLNNAFLDCRDQITIGDNVFFGHDVMILTSSHDYTKKGHDRMYAIVSKPVVIKDGVWIASRATILSGVTIGENSVIGAGSVVTKDVPANELWAGNPARLIKKI